LRLIYGEDPAKGERYLEYRNRPPTSSSASLPLDDQSPAIGPRITPSREASGSKRESGGTAIALPRRGPAATRYHVLNIEIVLVRDEIRPATRFQRARGSPTPTTTTTPPLPLPWDVVAGINKERPLRRSPMPLARPGALPARLLSLPPSRSRAGAAPLPADVP